METTPNTLSPADFERIEAKLDALNTKIDFIVERQRWQADLFDEFGPIAREAMRVGADRLHEIDQAGYFTFGREALRIVERIVESYGEDDVRQLGDHIVGIMDTVKNITQPAILAVANEATEVLYNSDDVEPMGVMGMVKASQDDEVQKGLAIMFEVLRQIGRTVSDVSAEEAQKARPVARERPVAPSRGRSAPVNSGVAAVKPAAEPAAPAPSNGAAVSTDGGEQSGWQLTADGHLDDPASWTREFAVAMAASLAVPQMTASHWQVVEFARKEWLDTKASPNIRRLTTGAGVSTKELYLLFPKAPARAISKIAGIPKPAGCI